MFQHRCFMNHPVVGDTVSPLKFLDGFIDEKGEEGIDLWRIPPTTEAKLIVTKLFGGFNQPIWKDMSQNGNVPTNRGENTTYLSCHQPPRGNSILHSVMIIFALPLHPVDVSHQNIFHPLLPSTAGRTPEKSRLHDRSASSPWVPLVGSNALHPLET